MKEPIAAVLINICIKKDYINRKTTSTKSIRTIICEGQLGKNHKTIADVSKDYGYLDDVIERMLQQEASGRYQELEELKRDLSVLSREYIASLKISQLDETIIPAHEIDDPIVADPIKIVDVSWEDGILNIHLNHQPSYEWMWALHNMGNYSSLLGKGPESFNFKDSKATIGARDANESQQIINHFKQWLPNIAVAYENKLIQKAKNEEQEKINEVRKEKEHELKKKSINESLQW